MTHHKLPNGWCIDVTGPDPYGVPANTVVAVTWGRVFMKIPAWVEQHKGFIEAGQFDTFRNLVSALPLWGKEYPYKISLGWLNRGTYQAAIEVPTYQELSAYAEIPTRYSRYGNPHWEDPFESYPSETCGICGDYAQGGYCDRCYQDRWSD